MRSDKKKLNHIAFIMDGNGRWAKEKGLPRNAGHKAGVDKAKEIILATKKFGVSYVSLYTFSKENWSRPRKEVSFLMRLIITHFKKEFEFYKKNRIKIIHIGDRRGVQKDVLDAIDNVVEDTKDFDTLTVLLAFNYSGKYDILQAINSIIKLDNIDEINENEFSSYLLTSKYPDPDLIVRTSGEFRISNFFLWQAAYSEFYIIDKYWPDFTKMDLKEIVDNFYHRDRRYGGIKNE